MILSVFCRLQTIEKVGSGFQYHADNVCWVSLEFRCCLAGQDAPPTGLVLYGFPYNPTVVLLYKVELRTCLKSPNLSLREAILGKMP